MPKEVNSSPNSGGKCDGIIKSPTEKKRTKSVKYNDTDEVITIPEATNVDSAGDAFEEENVAGTHANRQMAKSVQKKAAAQRKAFKQQRTHSKSTSSTIFQYSFNRIKLPQDEEEEAVTSLKLFYDISNDKSVPTPNYGGVVKGKQRRKKKKVAQGLRWGRAGDEKDGVAVLDENDPNYDSQNDEEVDTYFETTTYSLPDPKFDQYFSVFVKEYFIHQKTEIVQASLNWQNPTDNQLRRIPYLSISLALDNRALERELTSRLISDLCDGEVVKHEFISDGYDYILQEQLDELSVDVPDAAEVVGKFIARSIADDVLAPIFVTNYVNKIKSGETHGLSKPAIDAITCAKAITGRKHGLALLDDVWLDQRGECGKSNLLAPTKYLKKDFGNILLEYLIASNDPIEVYNRLLSLNVIHYHHQFVYQCVEKILTEPNLDTLERIDRLLKELHATGILSEDQIKIGVRRIYQDLPDLCIDAPTAYLSVGRFVESAAQKSQYLPLEVAQEMPAKPKRSRFISECPVGALVSGLSGLRCVESPDQSTNSNLPNN